jgi:hypothetical protein
MSISAKIIIDRRINNKLKSIKLLIKLKEEFTEDNPLKIKLLKSFADSPS